MLKDEYSTVAVIGSGTMGRGIAEMLARCGHAVRVIDLQSQALVAGRVAIEQRCAKQVEQGKLAPSERDYLLANISWHRSVDAAAGAGLAIEAIAENVTAKRALFAKLEAVLSPSAAIATNTSSLSVQELAAELANPERFLGLHFFNPVPAMRLVEIIRSRRTDETLLEKMRVLAQSWGKTPVVVADVPGFIVNRVARPFFAEAFAAWSEGIDPAVIDALLVRAGGFRMGPLALADMIGHDINYAVACAVHDGYGPAARFRPQPAQHALVEDGRLGRKSGKGVFDYAAPLPFIAASDAGVASVGIIVGADPVGMKVFIDRALLNGMAVAAGDAIPSGLIVADGVRIAMIDGRTLATREDCDVIIDVARNPRTADLFGFSARDDASAAVAIAFLASLGAAAVRLPDRPGLLVLRTLAQLANAAMDSVDDGSAEIDAIATAMQLGANHPESPLSWAERFGRSKVALALASISEAAGDPIYVPATGLCGMGSIA